MTPRYKENSSVSDLSCPEGSENSQSIVWWRSVLSWQDCVMWITDKEPCVLQYLAQAVYTDWVCSIKISIINISCCSTWPDRRSQSRRRRRPPLGWAARGTPWDRATSSAAMATPGTRRRETTTGTRGSSSSTATSTRQTSRRARLSARPRGQPRRRESVSIRLRIDKSVNSKIQSKELFL